MSEIVTFSYSDWNPQVTASDQVRAVDALEQGDVLHLPRLAFVLQEDERRFLDPAVLGQSKNISLDPSIGSLRGARIDEPDSRHLQRLLSRYATSSRQLLRCLLPTYEPGLEQARTSFRPAEIVGRRTSWRKDDTRLHDRMKADAQYQSSVAQRACEFPAGSTWMVFTDFVLHAAMSGQYAFEQTFHLPVSVMRNPSRAPLRVLENLRRRELA